MKKRENKKIMKSEICRSENKCKCGGCCCGGAIYGLGFIGSAIYYLSTASGFWGGVLGFLKALIWPAFLVYELLKFFGM